MRFNKHHGLINFVNLSFCSLYDNQRIHSNIFIFIITLNPMVNVKGRMSSFAHLYVRFSKSAAFFCVTEVATAKLLDLAEGANVALVHSGTKQTESDPFMVHNHATENNNTVWVR